MLKTLKLQAAFSVGASSGEDLLIVNECKTENTGRRGLSPKSLGRYKIRPGNGTMEVLVDEIAAAALLLVPSIPVKIYIGKVDLFSSPKLLNDPLCYKVGMCFGITK